MNNIVGMLLTIVLLGLIGVGIELVNPDDKKASGYKDLFHTFALGLVVNASIYSFVLAEVMIVKLISIAVAANFTIMTLITAVQCYKKLRGKGESAKKK